MTQIRKKEFCILGILYLLVPVCIFFIGYCRLLIGLPVSLLFIAAACRAVSNQPRSSLDRSACRPWMYAVIAVLIVVWVTIAGVGGFFWQNPWDHNFRNALFQDLVQYSWPVIQNGDALCYYMGYWMPAALVGKLFGLNAGYLFQYLWAILGVLIAFGLLCQYLGRVRLSNLFILIFFSGCDLALCALFPDADHTGGLMQALSMALSGQHMELATSYFNSSSNTTLLFWLYNQTIPFWVGFLLILLQKNNRSMALLFALMLLFSPFPCFGMVPLMVYLVLSDQRGPISGHNCLQNFRKAFSFENLAVVPGTLVLVLFLKSNASAAQVALLPLSGEVLLKFAAYAIFEYGIYLAFVYPFSRKDTALKVLFITIGLFSFVNMGHGHDFAWRTAIPLAFYLMLLVMRGLGEEGLLSPWKKRLLVLVLCVCALTPASEMIRTLQSERAILQNTDGTPYLQQTRSDTLHTIFSEDNIFCYDNFTALADAPFFRWIAR